MPSKNPTEKLIIRCLAPVGEIFCGANLPRSTHLFVEKLGLLRHHSRAGGMAERLNALVLKTSKV